MKKAFIFLDSIILIFIFCVTSASALPSYTITVSGTIDCGWLIIDGEPQTESKPGGYPAPGYANYIDFAGQIFTGNIYLDYVGFEAPQIPYTMTSEILIGGILLEPFDPFFYNLTFNEIDKTFGFDAGISPYDETSSGDVKFNYYENGNYNNSLYLSQGDMYGIGTWSISSSSISSYQCVENSYPVPEVGTIFLFGFGLIGSFFVRKFQNYSGQYIN